MQPAPFPPPSAPAAYTGDTVQLGLPAPFLLLDAANEAVVQGLPGSRPRVQGREWRLYFLLSCIVPLIFCLCLLIVTAINWRDMRDVLQTGITANATLVERFASGGRSRSYYLVYRYNAMVGGKPTPYTRRQSVGSSRYFDLRYRVGATVQIRYLATNPSNALLADTALPTETLLLWFTGTALTLSGLLVSLSLVWHDWRLARRGQLLSGIVQAVEPWPWKENRYQLRYRFVDPSGTWREGRARIAAAQAGSGRFAPGTTVAVLYADRHLFCLL